MILLITNTLCFKSPMSYCGKTLLKGVNEGNCGICDCEARGGNCLKNAKGPLAIVSSIFRVRNE